VCVNPSQSSSPEPPIFDKLQDFRVGCQPGRRQRMQIRQDGCAVFQVAARQFAGNKRMHQHEPLRKTVRQGWLAATQVLNPDGSVGEHHQAGRRRGMFDILGCVPPSAASRLPASRAISASSPARTKAVFSWIPVSSLARWSRLSSMINVVRICISMHRTCILVKAAKLASGDSEARQRPQCRRLGRTTVARDSSGSRSWTRRAADEDPALASPCGPRPGRL